MRKKDPNCRAGGHVMWRRVRNGGDRVDGRAGEAAEAGEVPRGLREQRAGAEGDVQG